MRQNAPNDLTIFNEALEIAAQADRVAYIERACGADTVLREKIVSLLAAYENDTDVFDRLGETGAMGIRAGARDLEQLGTVIGRYKLREKIGEGGCGVVYVAEQEEPVRRKVALKVIKLGMDTKSVIGRFEAERQALAMMDHANIAKVLDAGATETGRPYFVMELVRGIKITDYCDQNHLSTQERLRLFIQVCHAVQHAHQKGVIHRDLKPANILVTLNDGVAVPKVIDFGIAKATEGRLTDRTVYTEMHQFIGTPAYMSPEQAEMTSVDIDTRSDIYSLGVLLYELLTGRTPFDPQELLKVGLDTMRRIILAKEPPRPSTRLSTLGALDMASIAKSRQSEAPKLIHMVRGDLDWIVMKCLEKDRSRRYETANGLALDLQRHLDNEPVVARPPSAAYRVQKFVRRNRGMVTAAATIVAVLVLGVVMSTWQAIRATEAKRQAQANEQRAQTAQANEAQQRQRAEADERSAQQSLYVANMNLARQAWEDNNVGRLQKLLAETANSPTRGFEWYYWQRQTHLALMTLRGHQAGVSSVAFSPDGRRIVTGSYDRTAKVWDAASGKLLLTLKGHRIGVYSVAFSPDNRRIVTGSFDNTAKVWDAANGTNLLTIKEAGGIRSVALSPDGRQIVTASSDGTANVWEVASGKKLLTLKGHRDEVTAVAFSPDGNRIATGSDDKTAMVWDAGTGTLLLTIKDSGAIWSVPFSPDGQRIATGSEHTTVELWDSTTGMQLLTLKNSGPTWSVAFSPDGQGIVNGSHDQTAKVWEAVTGTQLFAIKGHCGPVTSVAFSPDGQRIVTGSDDGTAKVWEANRSGKALTLNAHSGRVRSVAFSSDGTRILSAGDQSAKVWEKASGKNLLTLSNSAAIFSAGFSPNGQRIVTGSENGEATVWDSASGRDLFTLRGHLKWILCVAYSRDGQRIVTGSGDRTARVWDANSGNLMRTLSGHKSYIQSVAFSPDARRIVTGSFDGTAKVWDAASGKELQTLKGHNSPIQSVAFSPDGRQIVTGSTDRTAKIWDTDSGKELLTLTGHGDTVESVAFSPEGKRIVTGSWDKTAKVWETTSGTELLTLTGHGPGIMSAAFSPDGQQIVTGGYDGTLEVWEVATAQQIATWQKEEESDAERLPVLGAGATYEMVTEHERALAAQSPGAITQWLVLAPIAFEGRTDEAALRGMARR